MPPEGFPADYDIWDRILVFLKRLWCDISNLQRICDTCHDKKTNAERIARLNTKYTEELDILEKDISDKLIDTKTAKKSLNKYIAKKKTQGMEKIVERAQILKQKLS